jgi:hypothetical protein
LGLRDKIKVVGFYLAALPGLLRSFFDPNLTWSPGRYVWASGEWVPHFFIANEVPLTSITCWGLPIEETVQYERVQRILLLYPVKPKAKSLSGRDTQRVFDLVTARLRSEDEFVVLVERTARGQYALVDGGTRVAILLSTGATTVKAAVALRGDVNAR